MAPVYRAFTKARLTGNEPPGYSTRWVTARRGWLSVFPDRLGCGSNVIRAADVRDAVLCRVRQGLIPGFVLAVPTPEDTWQFGLSSHGLSTDPSRSPNHAMQWTRQPVP